MYGLYTPIFALQAFCLYHAYRHHVEQRWYWFIVFFPLFGCIFYLIHHFNTKSTVNNLSEMVKGAVNSNYKIEQFEQAYQFTDTFTNRLNLADAYLEVGRAEDAIRLYRECATGFMADDAFIRMKLLHALYVNGNYQEAVTIGNSLENEKSFVNSVVRIAYAWALYYSGRSESAEKIFQNMDKTNTNYEHRVEYCRFLRLIGRTDDMKTKTAELLVEFDFMKGPERRLYGTVIREVRALAIDQKA